MNVDTLADDPPVTMEEAAVLDFEPAFSKDHEPNWTRFPDIYRPAFQLAWTMLCKTRPELTAMAGRMDNKDGLQLLDGLNAAVDTYKENLEMLTSAQARLMVVMAIAARTVRDGETPD